MKDWLGWGVGLVVVVLALAYPLFPGVEGFIAEQLQQSLGSKLPLLFIFAILALGLHVVVGNTGLLHLGIAASFGVGAYALAITTVKSNPFQIGFLPGLGLAVLASTIVGVVLSAPLLRLRGDYLALVTLGFGLVVMYLLRNFESITNGMQGINPIPPPDLNLWGDTLSLRGLVEKLGLSTDWSDKYHLFYYLTLGYLLLSYLIVHNLERSRLGRAWVAIREDELAASCMGIDAARAKLAALALGAALAGLAGGLFATRLTSTSEPTNAYNFNVSMTMICCLILGGIGNKRGVLVGVVLVFGYDQILAPVLDAWVQRKNLNPGGKVYYSFSGWKLSIFGMALILMMLLRPQGMLPARRGKDNVKEAK